MVHGFGCQVCFTKYVYISALKGHVRSRKHRKKMEEVFPKEFKDNVRDPGLFPVITTELMNQLPLSVIGVSLMTLCFSTESLSVSFYLCHACEESCPLDRIKSHLHSVDHCSNYFSYTNPNAVSFSWVPSMRKNVIPQAEITRELDKNVPGKLEVLHLPQNLLQKLAELTYPEVMRTLSENDKLLKIFEAVKPKRMMIQTYQSDSNRKHPLLGMQHLVECISVGPFEERYYLCTLCKLTLAPHMIIKHVLSLDHIYCYFNAWHSGTLKTKECYNPYSGSWVSTILDYARQTEEIHDTSNAHMKQVSLEPSKFTSVNFTCYSEALEELKSIANENEESSLITSIKPGNKLVLRNQDYIATKNKESSLTTSIKPGNKQVSRNQDSIATKNKESSLTTSIKPGNKQELHTVSAESAKLLYKLCCQECDMTFTTICQYFTHLSKQKHKQMLDKFFNKGEIIECCDRKASEWKPSLGIYQYVENRLEPAVGVSLVVTCFSSEVQVEPIYVCFACEDCFPESSLRQHFNSRKHLIHTLLYQNPWRLPFGWKDRLDVKVLNLMAWEEEKERGPGQMTLKIFDIPKSMFSRLVPRYKEVMNSLQLHHSLLKRGVPQRETYSKLKQNERFPLLGKQFMVMHDVCVKRHQSTEVSFLCLLCERRLSDEECYAHVFSWEHVAKFLDCFYPGSLSSSADAETLLDLAKQAACYHPISHVQVMTLEQPIWEPCAYDLVIRILRSVKRRTAEGNLNPPIKPKWKLIPRNILEDVDKGPVRDNSQMMEGFEKQTSQKPTGNNPETLKNISAGVRAENTNTHVVEEKGVDKEAPTQRKVFSHTSSEEIKNAESETCQVIKEEVKEEPTVIKPSGESPESCPNTDKADGTEIRKERSKSSIDAMKQLKNCTHTENERKRRMPEKSQEDTCPNDDVEKELGPKRQRLTSKQDTSCEEPLNLPSIDPADKEEGDKPTHEDKPFSKVSHQQAAQLWRYVKRKSREPVVGLGSLLECHFDQHDPIYLCECCALKVPEKDVISHVTGADHQRTYLVALQKLPPPPERHTGKNLRHLAAVFEQENGYGEAQVVDLDEEIYNNISQQNFESAIQSVKVLQAQQNRWHEVTSTSDPAVTLHTQHEVVDMEIDDDSEGSKAQPSSGTAAVSVKTETTSKIIEVPPESNENVKMTTIKVTESAEDANTHRAVSISSEDASSLHMSTSRTNTTCWHPDFTGNDLKAEIISNTTVGPLQIAATSKIAGTPQNASTSDSVVATSTKCMMAISKCPARSPNSTSNTTKLTAPDPSLSATASSSTSTTTPTTTATTKLRETASKATATTTRQTAPNLNLHTTSKIQKAHKYSEAASQTTAASQTIVAPVKCGNTKASANTGPVKKSVGPNADVAPNVSKTNAPAAPHPAPLVSVRSENKNPPTEPSHPSTSKTKTSDSTPKVGLNQLIVMTCEAKRQPYCQMCKVKLKHSNHLTSICHKYNYVRMKFPKWTAKSSELESKLDKIVANLAEVEKDVGSRCYKKIEVKIDVYEELKALPDDKAIERLKAMLAQRDSRVSFSTASPAEDMRQQVAFASPCMASSPDDGTLKEEGNLAVGQSDRAQSLKSSEANEPISDQFHLCLTSIKNEPEPIASPSIQEADIAVNIKQETFECDVDSQAIVEDPPETESPAVKLERPEGCPDPIAQTPDTCQTTAETRQQRERSDPELQDTRTVLEDSQKQSPAKFSNPDSFPSAASVNTELQKQSRPSQKAEPEPGHHSALETLLRSTVGERTQGCSNLPVYLRVAGLGNEPIIGLGSVWECRGASVKPLPPFFLCESCRETLPLRDICQHMVNPDHLYSCLLKQCPHYLWFWEEKDLIPYMKVNILKKVVRLLSEQECSNKMDAQVILLREDLYEYVRTAPFNEALEMVQNIKKEPNPCVFCPPISTDQQPEDQQSQEESLPKKKQSTQALETDQRRDNEVRPKTEKQVLEETSVVGDLDGDKQREVLSPLEVTSVFSKADSVVSLPFSTDTCHTPQEICRNLSVQPELRPMVSQHQRPIPELQVKLREVDSESPSTYVSPKPIQTLSVSPRDECLPNRKRPAVTCLGQTDTPNPQTEDLLPAKRSRSLQPINQPTVESASELIPDNPPANPTLLSAQAGPTSDDQSTTDNLPTVNWDGFTRLMSLVRQMRSKTKESTCMSGSDNAGNSSSCVDHPSECEVERRWDSNLPLVKATVKKEPLSTDSLEEMFSTAAPAVCYENQPVTEAKAVCTMTMLPSTSTTEPSDPQHQTTVNSQSMYENVNQFQPSPLHYVAANHNPSQTPQAQGHTETASSSDFSQLPINAIITSRSHRAKQECGRGRQYHFANSHSTVVAANPSDTLAASGGYGQDRQMAYVTNGQLSSYLSSQPVAGHTTTDNPSVYTGSLYQHERYTKGVFYPSQIYPEQEANHFGHLASPAPSEFLSLEMQQQLMHQQQQHQHQQQQLQQQQRQQQYSPWSRAPLNAGSGSGTSEADYLGAVPFLAQANSSQMFIDLNNYCHNRILQTQNNNNNNSVVTPNIPQVYFNPLGVHCPPANSEITSQAAVNSPFASGRGLFTISPSMVNAAPPGYH